MEGHRARQCLNFRLRNTSSLSAENLIQISSVVPEIWQVKVKSWGGRLFKQAHLFSEIRYQKYICNGEEMVKTICGSQMVMNHSHYRKT